jgi:hypothetical protein
MPPRDLSAWLGAWQERRRLDPRRDLLMREADGGLPM